MRSIDTMTRAAPDVAELVNGASWAQVEPGGRRHAQALPGQKQVLARQKHLTVAQLDQRRQDGSSFVTCLSALRRSIFFTRSVGTET